LAQNKTEVNKCENLLAKSVALTEEFKTISQEYQQLMVNINQDYCFLYPDTNEKNCQILKKK
jgi:hypothetical protein